KLFRGVGLHVVHFQPRKADSDFDFTRNDWIDAVAITHPAGAGHLLKCSRRSAMIFKCAVATESRAGGNGRKDCERKYNSEPEGTMSSKGKVANMRVKDLNLFELTPGLADALTASLDASYLEYFTAIVQGRAQRKLRGELQPYRRKS